jgi:predicted aspartyl protease
MKSQSISKKNLCNFFSPNKILKSLCGILALLYIVAEPKVFLMMRQFQVFLGLIFLFFILPKSTAQSRGFQWQPTVNRVDIPFQFVNNFIVIDIMFQQTLSVKFIFDTGAEHTILCKKEIAELMGVSHERTFKIFGADMRTELTAYLARHVSLKVKNTYIEAPRQDILILEDDYFKIDEASGEKIAGILGADMFNQYVVKINYVKKIISLFNADHFTPPPLDDFESFDIDIKNGKPYCFPTVFIQAQDSSAQRILIDTGASLSFLLFSNSHPSLQLPTEHIKGSLGVGLGGNIEGYVGKIQQLKISPKIRFPLLFCNFQEVDLHLDSSLVATRNGILGAGLLSRFTIYIDYVKSKLYLKPNTYFTKPIRYDKSGLNLVAVGADLDQFIVHDIVQGSPAAWADIRKDDEILSVNGILANYYDLQQLTNLFKKKKNKSMRVIIKRNGHRYVKHFVLRDLL